MNTNFKATGAPEPGLTQNTFEQSTQDTDISTDEEAHEESGELSVKQPFLFIVLHCDQLGLGGARYALTNVSCVTLGRGHNRTASRSVKGGAGCLDISLPSSSISKSHARVVRRGAAWVLEDNGSRNGSFVNGSRVARAELRDGDWIDVGSVILRFRAAMPASKRSADDLDSERAAPAAPSFLTLVPAYEDRLSAVLRIARTNVTTLLFGETGTGKEILATAMHTLSGRQGPLIAVNCGGLSPSLIESQMFGHVKGAFTGAVQERSGFIRSAQGGTLFLDEIGDLPMQAQATLLRSLQEREVVPVGCSRPVTVDMRVIAATHRPIHKLCLRGEFRSDLFARLAGYQHTLLPLRDRMEDLGVLLRDILHQDIRSVRLSVAAARRLIGHSWPLNIRQLSQVIAVARTFSEDSTIKPTDIPESSFGPADSVALERVKSSEPEALRAHLTSLLEEHRGNISEVARAMGKQRVQIHRWMQRFRIDPNDYRC